VELAKHLPVLVVLRFMTLGLLASPRYAVLAILLMSSAVFAQPQSTTNAPWRLVNYWSEWCSPCRKEIPMLNALSHELDPAKVLVLGVNFDDDPRQVTLKIATKLQILFPTLTDEETADLGLRDPHVMPTTYLVSPGNKLVETLIGLQSRASVLKVLADHGLVGNHE